MRNKGFGFSDCLIIMLGMLILGVLVLPNIPGVKAKITKPAEETASSQKAESKEKPAEEPEEVVQYYLVKKMFPANDADGITHFYVCLENVQSGKLFEADVKRHLYLKFDTGETYADNELPLLHVIDRLKPVPEIVEKSESKDIR